MSMNDDLEKYIEKVRILNLIDECIVAKVRTHYRERGETSM